MSRVAFSLLAAAAVTVTAAGSAQAGCGCGTDFGFAAPAYVVQPAPQLVTVQPPPVTVAIQPPPVIVQAAPIVQQYVVNQGPVYSGPMLTDYNPSIYYAPRAVSRYPYVAGGYPPYGYRAPYAPRYPGYPPISRYY